VWLWRTRPPTLSPAARSWLIAACVLTAAGLLMTLSRQSWVGLLAGLAALSLRRDPVRPVVIVAALFLLLAVIPAPGGHGTFGDYLLTASDTSMTRLNAGDWASWATTSGTNPAHVA